MFCHNPRDLRVPLDDPRHSRPIHRFFRGTSKRIQPCTLHLSLQGERGGAGCWSAAPRQGTPGRPNPEPTDSALFPSAVGCRRHHRHPDKRQAGRPNGASPRRPADGPGRRWRRYTRLAARHLTHQQPSISAVRKKRVTQTLERGKYYRIHET